MERITALVTGADHPTGLGSARALRAAGARVVGFADHPGVATCRSRAWSEVRPLRARTPADVAQEILTHAASIDGPVFLLSTVDDLVLEFARLQHQFPAHVRSCLPPLDTAEILLEKTRFAIWAAERGFPVPRTAVAESMGELEALLRDFPLPSLLKPMFRTREWDRNSPLAKVIILKDRADLRGIGFDLFAAAPSYVLSEWIDGEDSDVLFYLTYLGPDSEIVAGFSGRKLLQYPRLTGSTAVCTDNVDPVLDKMSEDLFRAARCTGLASLEVKRSPKDNRYLITEPTVGRPNLQSPCAELGGRNIVGIAMRHTWGRHWSDLVGSERRCLWVEESAIFQLLTSPGLPPFPARMIAGEALHARRFAGAHFRLSDPAPFTSLLAGWVKGGLRRGSGRGVSAEARA